jgi:hypothetical protein
MVFEMLGFYLQPRWLVAWEEFSQFIHHKSLKSYSTFLILEYTFLYKRFNIFIKQVSILQYLNINFM